MEEERMKLLTERNAEAEQWFGPRNKVTVGFRLLSSGGHVDFSNLGAVPAKVVAEASAGAVDRVYDDGTVSRDVLRANEVDASGNQLSSPGGRYATYFTNSDGTKGEQNGDYVSYTPGQTRTWVEYTDAQLTSKPGYIGFTNYSTTSEGGHFTDKPGPSAGVELQFSRDMGRLSRRIQWGFSTGIALNGINSKVAGDVTSTLNTRTDYYAIVGGSVVGAPISAPSTNTYINPDSGNTYSDGYETSTPLSQTPSQTVNGSVAGGATVSGRWEIKGAYFLVKLGPSLKAQFTDRLEASISAGFAGAYVGTTYTATESFTVPGVFDYTQPNVVTDDAGNSTTTYPLKTDLGVVDPQSSSVSKFVTGYYADFNMEWAANETTALFGGLTAQKLSAYDQMVAERLAHIDLGSAVGVRGGISIKF